VPSEREQYRLNLLGGAANTQVVGDLGNAGIPATSAFKPAAPPPHPAAPAPGSRAAHYANGSSFAARAANGAANARRQQP
jgi:hypothetical protein